MVVGELRHQCEELRVAHQVQMNELISMVSTVRRAIKVHFYTSQFTFKLPAQALYSLKYSHSRRRRTQTVSK